MRGSVTTACGRSRGATGASRWDILGRVKVLIVTYGCTLGSAAPISISSEHKEVGLFGVHELDRLPMPEGYRASVPALVETEAYWIEG